MANFRNIHILMTNWLSLKRTSVMARPQTCQHPLELALIYLLLEMDHDYWDRNASLRNGVIIKSEEKISHGWALLLNLAIFTRSWRIECDPSQENQH